MTSIDKRVVEMGFNNKQFENGVKATIDSLGNLKKSLNLGDSVKGLLDLGAITRSFSLANIGSAVDTIASRFGVLGIMGVTALQNITNAAVNAGKQMVSSLTIDPISTGFTEFELKMGSIQTIMSGSGESLQTVNKYLNDLNTYSDKTIYSFKDMTSNIGKFTNAGVSLKDSVAAIQGIANVAAISGANAEEASRAMYNFAQSLSSGAVKLMDWKSIENANMATVGFKTELLNAAVAAGTLKKSMDGTYKTIEGTVITATKGFNESLQEQWLTSKVLTTTLGKYADETTEVGKKATRAAQDVKTFSQMMDTLKEAAGSGWAATWEILVGNFDESKELFTGINNVLSGIIGSSADARNKILQGWKDLGGRTMLIETIKNAFQTLSNVLKPIGEAFKEIFPPITAKQLVNLTISLYSLVKNFKIGADAADKLKRTFKGLFSVFSLVFKAVGFVAEGFGKLVGSIKLPTDSILDFTAKLGDSLVKLKDTTDFNVLFAKGLEKVKEILAQVGPAFQNFITSAAPVFEKIKTFLTETFANIDLSGFAVFGEKVKEILKPFSTIGSDIEKSIEKITPALASGKLAMVNAMNKFTKSASTAGGPLDKIGEDLKKVFDWLKEVFGKLAPIFNKIGDALKTSLSNMGQGISKGLETFDFKAITDVLSVGLLGAIIIAIRKFLEKGSTALDGVAGILDGVQGSLKAWQSSLKAKTLMTIALAIAVLAASLIALSLVDDKKISKALATMTIVFGELLAAKSIAEKASTGGGGLGRIAVEMVLLSTAILIMSAAVTKLGAIDQAAAIQGVIAMGAIMAELTIFTKTISAGGLNMSVITSIIGLAIALNVMQTTVAKFGSMDQGQVKQGLIVLGAVLTEITLFTKYTKNAKDVISTAIGIGILAGSMMIFGLAIKTMAGLNLSEIAIGLGTIGATLAIVTIALNNLKATNVIGSAIGIGILGAAMMIFAGAIKLLATIPIDQLFIGISAITMLMSILAVSLSYMQNAIPGAIAVAIIAGALMLLVPVLLIMGAVPWQVLAVGIGALAAVFLVLGLAGLVLGPVVPVLLALGGAMMLIAIAGALVGQGLLLFAGALSVLAISGLAGAAAMVGILTILLSVIPLVVSKVVEGIVLFAQLIANAAPTLVAALITTLSAVIAGIMTMVPQIAAAALALVISLLQTIETNLPTILESGMKIIISLLEGINKNIEKITEVAIEIVLNFIKGVVDKLPDIIQAGWDLILSFIQGLTDSVSDNLPVLLKAITDLANAIIKGLVDGLMAGISSVAGAISDIGNSVVNGLKGILGIHSPSKETDKIGRLATEGFVRGLTKYESSVEKASKDLGQTAIDGLGKAISNITDIMTSDLNMTPTIRPVIDLTDVAAGGLKIDKLLNDKKLNVSISADKLSSIANGMQPKNVDSQINQPLPGTSFAFTQNNYSPTALSRLDIYRQTRNQLAVVKRLVRTT